MGASAQATTLHIRLGLRVASCALFVFSLGLLRVVFHPLNASAQDEPYFKPRFEATRTPTPVPPAPVYSFSKLEPALEELCVGLERDGRRQRLLDIAGREAKSEKECISCRSFWKSFVLACSRAEPKRTPTPKAAEPVSTPAQGAPSSEEEGGGEAREVPAEKNTPVPAPTRLPRQPSTELIDSASRVSTELYAQDAGDGPIYLVLDRFVTTVMEQGDLTVAERAYYETFTAYLMAAWQGRETEARHYPRYPQRPVAGPAPTKTPSHRVGRFVGDEDS